MINSTYIRIILTEFRINTSFKPDLDQNCKSHKIFLSIFLQVSSQSFAISSLIHHLQVLLDLLQARNHHSRAESWTVKASIIHGSCRFEQDQARLSIGSSSIHPFKSCRSSVSTLQSLNCTNPALHLHRGQISNSIIHEMLMCF